MKTAKFLLPALLAFGLVSCNKDKTDDSAKNDQLEESAAEDIAMSMNYNEEMTTLGQMSLEGEFKGKKSSNASWQSCVTFTADTTGPTTEITLDFGSTNCQGADGKYRRGILIVTFEDNPFDKGSVVEIESNGFAINDHEIAGTKTITYMGLNNNGDPYNALQTSISITRPDGKVISWNSTQQRVWSEGFGNFDPYDNVVEVSGSANGTTANGTAYNIDILTPLRVEASCSNIVSGTFRLSGPTFADRVFDYGNGDCDKKASVTVNGTTYNFMLK